jgi:anti-sigma factor RsiW
MPIDDETLMALADGEIDGDEAEALHARIKADPDLAARYTLFSQTSDWVAQAALNDPEAEVSDDLTARIREMAAAAPPAAENVVSLRRPAPRWQPMAIAASVALAVGLSAGLFLSPDALQTGTPMLSAALQERLGTLPSGAEAALPDGRRVHVIASFQDGAGAFCREYETAAEGGAGLVGVACRNGADWSLRFAMATTSGRDGYAPASSLEALDAFYAATGASQPLSAEAELAYLK